MADQKDGRSQNQPPAREEAAKGGRHSHDGSSDNSQPEQGQGGLRQPTTDETSKGGRHSQSGINK